MVTDIEAFVCLLHSKPQITSVNMGRYVHFLDNFKPKKNSEPLKSLKGVDEFLFPPCKSVLLEKIKRTNFVACITKIATMSGICTWKPENHAWNLQSGRYEIKWFEGREVPENVCSHIDDNTVDPTDENEQLVYAESSDESDIETI